MKVTDKTKNTFRLKITMLSFLAFIFILQIFILANKELVKNIDTLINVAIYSIRNSTLNDIFIGITQIGEWYSVALLLVIISALFWIFKKRSYILPFAIAVISSGIIGYVSKFIIDRERPDQQFALVIEKTDAFPSLHSATVSAILGFLIYFVWKENDNKNSELVFTILSILLILLVGFSRLYLGVHYLSDVIVGYLVGVFCVLVGILIFQARKNHSE